MADAPSPAEIFERAVEEGKRRLDQTLLELLATAFIAGFTIVFGIVALALVHGAVPSRFGELDQVAGALAFGVGVVFLIVGRAELFSENFFDPIATVFAREETGRLLYRTFRLWGLTLVLNLVGGALFVLVFSYRGVLPEGARAALTGFAESVAASGSWTEFMSAICGGALVALLSFLLAGAGSTLSRIVLAYVVGFLLALGSFDHVVVTMLHVLFGIALGAEVGFGEFFAVMGIVTAGNLVGGIGVVTMSHVAQVKGAEE